MPGPSRWRGELINHALMSRKLENDIVDQRVREVLKCVHRAIKTGTPENASEEPRDTVETASLLRDIAGQSVVLLKNTEQVLPFKKDKPVSCSILTHKSLQSNSVFRLLLLEPTRKQRCIAVVAPLL